MTGGHSPFQNECRLLVPSLGGSGVGCTGPLCSPTPVGGGGKPWSPPRGLEASHLAAEEDTPPSLGPRPLPKGPGAQSAPPRPPSLRTQPCPPTCRAERRPAAARGCQGAVSPPCWEPETLQGQEDDFRSEHCPRALRLRLSGNPLLALLLPVSGT